MIELSEDLCLTLKGREAVGIACEAFQRQTSSLSLVPGGAARRSPNRGRQRSPGPGKPVSR
jgi:hypothetical protein